jgi:hypothetical protein
MLCGDEVQAAVVDLGSSVCKFGSSGSSICSHVFRGDIGKNLQDEYVVGDSKLRFIRQGLDILRPFGNSDLNFGGIPLLCKYF